MRLPGSRRRATVVVNDTNPLAALYVGALDVGLGLRLAGRAGRIRSGLTGSAGVSYRGDLGPQQQFRGYSGPASGQANKRTGAAMALPMTGVPDPTTGLLRGKR